MKTSVTRRCRECGIGNVRPVSGAGRVATYKKMKVEIPADVAIPTCDNCGVEWMDRATAKALDAALEKVYRAELRALFVETVRRLAKIASMRRVEEALALSEGYLSKVKQGRSEPSANLVSSLALLSLNTEVGLSTLEQLWKHDVRPDLPSAPPLSLANPRASRVRRASMMHPVLSPVGKTQKKKGKRASSGSGSGRRHTA